MAVRKIYKRFRDVTAKVIAGACLAASTALLCSNVQAGTGVSIHRYADFNQQTLAQDRKSIATAAARPTVHTTRISVYGKQLTLQLADHSALLGVSSPLLKDITLQQGSIAGVTGSWVRLTQVAAGMHGLIWDGADMYAIEPAAEVRGMLDPAVPVPTSDTIIFKLSDTTVDLPGNYCADDDHHNAAGTGLATYQALTTALAQSGVTSDGVPTLRLEMQAVPDAAFRAAYVSDQAATDALIVRLNNVDGIYTAQLGLAIEATNIWLLDANTNLLSTSTDPATLLSSLAQVRSTTPGMGSYAATHLFTGRDLDGDILGISYIGNLCGARYAVSLSELRDRGAWLDSLVAAHELGHQLGAVHDGTGACSETPSEGYLMSAIINGSQEFSACSRDMILAGMQRAACLIPLDTGGASSGLSNSAPPVTSDHGGGGTLSIGWLLLLSTLMTWQRWLLHRRAA